MNISTGIKEADIPALAKQIAGQGRAEYEGDIFFLHMEHDPHTEINDFDCYGKVASVQRGRYGTHAERPKGFDGGALKIRTHSEEWWWQPYEGDKTCRHLVQNLLEYGFTMLRLERCSGTDAYGKPIVVAFDTLGAIDDASDPDEVALWVADMLTAANG